MNINLHRSINRGHVNNDRLQIWHSFSYATYFNPLRDRFGVIRVLNEEVMSGGSKFDSHVHRNMEILTIPLSGAYEHIDDEGSSVTVQSDEVLLISAGTGIHHIEGNYSLQDPLVFLQIWLFPKVKGINPRLERLTFSSQDRSGKLQLIASPNKAPGGLFINQDAWLHRIDLPPGAHYTYSLHKENQVVMMFVIEGSIMVDRYKAERGDSLEISNITGSFQFRVETNDSALDPSHPGTEPHDFRIGPLTQLLIIEAPPD